MKRTLPIIIILIGLSLLGLVILQASWLNNLLKIRQNQIEDKISKAQQSVIQEFLKELNNSVSTKSPSISFNHGLNNWFGDDFRANLFQPKRVSKEYNVKEVKSLIDDAFAKEGLSKYEYEFAVVDTSGTSELFSTNFRRLYNDTSSRRSYGQPISEVKNYFQPRPTVEYLNILVPNFEKYVWGSLTWILIGSLIFTLIIFAAFYITVRTLLLQKKLSEIKSDFINNMTHEFKTPLATISLAVDAIKNEKVQNDPVKLQYFSNIIKEENKRMNSQVEIILQAALLEKKDLQFKVKDASANFLVATVVDNFQLQLNDKNGKCEINLAATEDIIEVDELHFSNAISNLFDNAIKYSKENLLIKISSYNKDDKYFFKIEDNGIGMSKETVKNVFEKFFRAHTGNVHNVKGFGLGMSYVKTIVDEFNGEISVSSVLGKGTTFIVEMPLKNAS